MRLAPPSAAVVANGYALEFFLQQLVDKSVYELFEAFVLVRSEEVDGSCSTGPITSFAAECKLCMIAGGYMHAHPSPPEVGGSPADPADLLSLLSMLSGPAGHLGSSAYSVLIALH